ncbi:Protein amnionless [Amphibalanus amphitrite]|uniref:Protein amnionless n=1 Tax=Amphibalanus amphitrite TaxID=1232801 RepID=A0A6A4XAC6_AMPAM|nr:Protein amnionless [Amphibalanus amphitrite]
MAPSLAALVPAPVCASLKVWGRQLSMDSQRDWLGGRRPCAGQVALLPDGLAVYLHEQFEARTMVLPTNGEIILGEGASVALADRPARADSRCRGTDGSTVRFGGSAARWMDAGSWRQAALPSPVPHSERVPCASGGDSVRFPENITYRVQVQRAITVRELSIGPHAMDTERFRTFRNTTVGRSLFDVRAGFNITGVGRTCRTEECACGNDRAEVLSVICAATECGEAPCSRPVQPVGHCCPMCGAVVRVTPSAGRPAAAADLRRLVRELSGSGAVRWHVSATHAGRLQTVLVDVQTERTDSARLARELADRLAAEPGMSGPEVHVSGPRHAALTGGGGAGGGRSAAGPVLATLVLVVVAALLVWAVRTKRVRLPSRERLRLPPPPSQWHVAERTAALAGQLPAVRRRLAAAAAAPFHFARFRNSTCGSEASQSSPREYRARARVELGQRVEELDSAPDSASVHTADSSEPDTGSAGPPAAAPPKAPRSFDNPLFGNTKLDDHVPATLLAPSSALCVTPDGKSVANPFFGVPVITAAGTNAETVGAPGPGLEDRAEPSPAGREDSADPSPAGREDSSESSPAPAEDAAEPEPPCPQPGDHTGPEQGADGAARGPPAETELLIDVQDSD